MSLNCSNQTQIQKLYWILNSANQTKIPKFPTFQINILQIYPTLRNLQLSVRVNKTP